MDHRNVDQLLMEARGLLRARDILLYRIHVMAVDEHLPVDTRILAIERWTAAWCEGKP